MAYSVTSPPSFHHFPLLPCELRLAIIEECLPGLRNIAAYATIDRQWKSVVEKRTFRFLKLRVDNINKLNTLDDLERICVEDRINAVSAIHLVILVNNLARRNTESRTNTTNGTMHQGSRADTNAETDSWIVDAERMGTAAFGRLFRILESWSRNKEPLSFTYEFLREGPRSRWRPSGINLRIDSSTFPDVACIGSLTLSQTPSRWGPMYGSFDWGVEPASTFHLLSRLPNVKSASMTFDDDLESPEIMKTVQERCSTPSFQKSELKKLHLESIGMWLRKRDPMSHTHPSLRLSQSIFAMTSKLEELCLLQVVDVPCFLKEARNVNGNTSQSTPAWPNMKILILNGYSSSGPSDDPSVAAELSNSVTKALPHLPNLTRLDITVISPTYDDKGRCDWFNTIIYMEVPPRDDRSMMREGRLLASTNVADEETVDKWQKIARSQWNCKLNLS